MMLVSKRFGAVLTLLLLDLNLVPVNMVQVWPLLVVLIHLESFLRSESFNIIWFWKVLFAGFCLGSFSDPTGSGCSLVWVWFLFSVLCCPSFLALFFSSDPDLFLISILEALAILYLVFIEMVVIQILELCIFLWSRAEIYVFFIGASHI